MNIGKIGFGTTGLLALSGEGERQRLLGAALDAGITHFDTAPYYGYGEAEKILGRFIKGMRSRVTVTTKFGIRPPRLAGGGSVAGAVKRLVRHLAPLRKLLADQAGKMVQRGAFGAADAEESLEASLRALQTDHIDIYLLHEAGPGDTSDELLAFLEKKTEEGVIGRFGTGSEFARVAEIAATRPGFAGVLQFENSATRPNLRQLPAAGGPRLAITHGALGGSFREAMEAMGRDAGLRRRCSAALNADAGEPGRLAEAMLAWAAHANRDGAVLFSSSRTGRVRANAEALRSGSFSSSQIEEFGRAIGPQPGAQEAQKL